MGVRIQAVARDFPRLHNVEPSFGAHLVSSSVRTGVLSPEVKRPGLEFDHSPPLLRLRISAAVPLVYLFDIISGIGTVLPFLCKKVCQ